MTEQEISKILEKQKAYFAAGHTLPVEGRLAALKRLKESVKTHEGEIHQALKEDLGKSAMESYMCETGMVLSELSYMIKHLRSFAREKRVLTPLAQYVSRSFKKPSPYGNVLIMSPWNYPFMLTIEPLVDALAAGNTALVKPSAYSPTVSAVIAAILKECFPPEYVSVIQGGREENQFLLRSRFDYIFFTGSQQVGKEVLRQASEHLTPVALELGGKSPCIVDETANLKLAARRIVFGKFLNCGQTCVAPDYILCHETVIQELLEHLKKEIKRQYTDNPLGNENYGKIISEKHFQRICGLMDPEKVILGGKSNPKTRKIEPTILAPVTREDAVMGEEIFGPLLPVMTFRDLKEAVADIENHAHPLALYIFSSSKSNIRYVTGHCRFGGGCINDTIIHLATSNMGFGGFGESGMGSYHGRDGFEAFSHYKSIVDKKTFLDLPMRYQPYKEIYHRMVRMFLK